MSIKRKFEEEYLKSENKDTLDYWEPLANIISEFLQIISDFNEPEEDIIANTGFTKKQISEFQSLEKIPSYDFFANLTLKLDQKPFCSMFGAYTVTLPKKFHNEIDRICEEENRDSRNFLEEIFEQAVQEHIKNKKKS